MLMITKWVVMVMAGVDLRESPLNEPRSPVATSPDNVSVNCRISSIDNPVVTGVMVGELATSMMQSAISASCETVRLKSSNCDDNAHLDVSAQGVWRGQFKRKFFDARVVDPSTQSNCQPPLISVCRRHAKERKSLYEQRVLEVEHPTFTPLLMSSTGGMAPIATTFYSHLAYK